MLVFMKPLSLVSLALLVWVMGAVVWALLDKPTAEDKLLAQDVAAYCARELGNLPVLSLESPTPDGKAYAHHAATGRLVVIAIYGYRSELDMQRARNVVRLSFQEFPALEAISLVFYTTMPFWKTEDGTYTHGKALFESRELINRRP